MISPRSVLCMPNSSTEYGSQHDLCGTTGSRPACASEGAYQDGSTVEPLSRGGPMITLLRLKLPETLRAVAPLIGVVCVLQFTVVGASPAVFLQFLAGSTLVTLGLLLLFTGVDVGILPIGRVIGSHVAVHRW